VHVLNLPSDVERWQVISARLESLGIDFHRVEGVDFTVPQAYAKAKEEGLVPHSFNFTLAQTVATTPLQAMAGILGAMGCAAAHLKAQRQAAAHGRRPLALVLEDDVMLADDFAPKLRRLLTSEAPCDWAAISLSSKCPYGECVSPHLARVVPDGNEPAERCRHGVNYGFYAMLYRRSSLDDLRERLTQRVWTAERPHCLDVDVALASMSDEVAYYAVPHFQKPGFLSEGGQPSTRIAKNVAKPPPDFEGEAEALHTPAPTLPPVAPSCAVYGCVDYRSSQPCQCNSLCRQHNNCCPDYIAVCRVARRTFTSSASLRLCELFGAKRLPMQRGLQQRR